MSEKIHLCSATVQQGFHSYGCSNLAKIERGGRWYCGTHDPVAVKAKRDARNARFMRELDARVAEREQAAASQAELERRAACFDDLLAALTGLLAQTSRCFALNASGETAKVYAMDTARAAIEKATKVTT